MGKKDWNNELFKKNVNRAFYVLFILLVIGMISLGMILVEFNSDYVRNRQILYIMSNEVMQLEKEQSSDNWKLKNYDFLEYKVNAFEKKFPDYSKIIDATYRKSHEYGFHPDLVLGIIQVESNFEPKAVSSAGAYGLMQVNLAVWKDELEIDEYNIFDVDYNIDLGLQILKRYLMESNGDMQRALHLYNNGYKYNNTAYIGKVGKSLFSLNRNRSNVSPGNN